MARNAVVRSASLSPAEAALADEVARDLANGSFSELVKMMLRCYAEPLKRRLEVLRAAGLDPEERLAANWVGETDLEAELRSAYGPQPETWRR